MNQEDNQDTDNLKQTQKMIELKDMKFFTKNQPKKQKKKLTFKKIKNR